MLGPTTSSSATTACPATRRSPSGSLPRRPRALPASDGTPRDYAELRAQGWNDSDVRRLLDDHGLVLHEVDALALDRLALLDAAVALTTGFGAHHLQVQGNRPGSIERGGPDRRGHRRPRRRRRGERRHRVPSVQQHRHSGRRLEIAERSRRPNVGVQVDIWHHVRGANDWAMLEEFRRSGSRPCRSTMVRSSPSNPTISRTRCIIAASRRRRVRPGALPRHLRWSESAATAFARSH